MEVLYESADVRRAIRELFSDSSVRRVAVVGFVGDGAVEYLPHPQGIELVCWPKAGGTNPRVLDDLLGKGVEIRFADRVHMKLYWAQSKGAIITSANLTTNALGSGDLNEIGVRLDTGAVDIERVLGCVRGDQPISAAFARLHREHNEYWRRNRIGLRSHRDEGTFATWFGSPSTSREHWVMHYWDERCEISKHTREWMHTEYARSEPWSTLALAQSNGVKRGDFVLSFRLTATKTSNIQWVYAEKVIRVPRHDPEFDKDTPYEVVQPSSPRHYEPPPFKIDGPFRKAFAATVKAIGDSIDASSPHPTKAFLAKLANQLR